METNIKSETNSNDSVKETDEPIQDKPQDLSMKTAKRSKKPIPPPLDLNARTLDSLGTAVHPGGLFVPRECLPIRKRPLIEIRRDLHDCKSPKSASGSNGFPDLRSPNTAPSSPLLHSAPPISFHHTPFPHHPSSLLHHRGALPLSSTLALTPSSGGSAVAGVTTGGGSSSAAPPFTHFPVPPPLVPAPPPTSPVAAAAAAAALAMKSPFLAALAATSSGSGVKDINTTSASSAGGYPTPPNDAPHNPPYPWAIFPSPFSPHSPLLLSPAPSSYPSSTNSSREDLPVGSQTLLDHREDSKRRLLSKVAADSSSPVPSSPLLSPRTWTHSWPTPAWQCFVQGTMIKFILPDLDTPWQKAEDLGWKDKISMKVDANNKYQYAPNGLTVVKMDVITRDPPCPSRPPTSSEDPSATSAFTPVASSTASDSSEANTETNGKFVPKRELVGNNNSTPQTLLRLRMTPHLGDNTTEILAECPLDHPFYVKEKGWCSAQPRMTIEKYGIPCQDLAVGDTCLPPNHPEAVRTPDLCDRFRRFEFDDPISPMTHDRSGRPMKKSNLSSSTQSPPPNTGSAKKKEKDPDKPKRPMNGFMLFAKKYRLELIQQHPGKDNRAISVLLGEAWKSLPQEEREQFSQKAKVMADEQKKLFPDCWKRKRTINSGQQQQQQQQQQQAQPPLQQQQHHVSSAPMATSTTFAFPSFLGLTSMTSPPQTTTTAHHHHHHPLAQSAAPATTPAATI